MINRKDDIVREAARLFRERGYSRTSVREIADAVDMQSGSLFYHFKSKEEILVEVMIDGIEALQVRLDEALQEAETPREKLLALLTVHLTALLEEQRNAIGVYLFEWRNLSDKARSTLIAERDNYEAHIMEILREVAESGLIQDDVKLFRLFLLGAMNWTAEWYNPDGDLSAAQIAERYLEFVIKK